MSWRCSECQEKRVFYTWRGVCRHIVRTHDGAAVPLTSAEWIEAELPHPARFATFEEEASLMLVKRLLRDHDHTQSTIL